MKTIPAGLIVTCPGQDCGRGLYKIRRELMPLMQFVSEDFVPVSDNVPTPVNGIEALCPFCGRAWTKGGMVILAIFTNEGWKSFSEEE